MTCSAVFRFVAFVATQKGILSVARQGILCVVRHYTDDSPSKSINSKTPKYQFDTLDCSLEELAVLKRVAAIPTITQQELVRATGKSIATVKRMMKSLQDKQYIRRENGKRYGKWEVLV